MSFGKAMIAGAAGVAVLGLACAIAAAQSPAAKPNLSCTPGNLAEVQPEVSQGVGEFLHELQAAVRKNDKEAASQLFNYPFTVHMKTGKFVVKNQQEFEQKYSRIFPQPLIDLVESQQTQCLNRVGDKGYMLGRGEIWFDQFSGGKLQAFSVNLVFY